MAKRSKKITHHRVFHDILSSAEHDKKHSILKENIIHEERKVNVILLLIFFIGVMLGIFITMSALRWILSIL